MREFEQLNINNNLPVFHLQFFPCIKQLMLFEQFEKVSIDIFEYFPKQTFRSRTTVLSSQGLLNIIVPTKKKGKEKILMRDVEISYSEKWNIEAWRTIFSCYGKSPYFLYYSDTVKEILFKRHTYLLDLNFEVFQFLKQSMKLSCELSITSQYIDRKEDNYRDMFLPKSRIEDGENLPTYYQCFFNQSETDTTINAKGVQSNGFQTNLSALDLLFNLGNESKLYLKNAIRQMTLTK